MGHHLVQEQSAYGRMVERLNRFPQGAPPSETLFKILKMLFSEKEAGLVAQMPIKPFTAAEAARIWQMTEAEAHDILDKLADRAMLVDIEQHGKQTYCLPPPMAGFFEFALMRVNNDIDQQALSELYWQYLDVEEDFVRELFTKGDTELGRIFVQEPVVKAHDAEILDYERATEVIETATALGIRLCYCRHKKQHLGTACDAPLDICMTFNTAAHSLIKHGHARAVDKAECRDLLQKAYACNLVQFGENAREGVSFICNCCGCCCEALGAVKRFQMAKNIYSNFIATLHEDACLHCGKCARVCPVDALHAEKNADGTLAITFTPDMCLGCGVCARNCPSGGVTLEPRPERVITPVNTTHRVVLMAAERGNLQDVIFDNKMLYSHRILAAVLGTILKLPDVGRSLAQKQLKSRYIEALMRKIG